MKVFGIQSDFSNHRSIYTSNLHKKAQTSFSGTSKAIIPMDAQFKEYKYNNTTIRVVRAPMETIEADAYVVPHYISHNFKRVSPLIDIYKAGAMIGLENFFQLRKKNDEGRCKCLPEGYIHIVPSGGGKSKNLINIATVQVEPENEIKVVKETLRRVFEDADRNGIESIVLPQINQRGGKYNSDGRLMYFQCAGIIANVIDEFAPNSNNPLDICIAIHPDEPPEYFETCWKKIESKVDAYTSYGGYYS